MPTTIKPRSNNHNTFTQRSASTNSIKNNRFNSVDLRNDIGKSRAIGTGGNMTTHASIDLKDNKGLLGSIGRDIILESNE